MEVPGLAAARGLYNHHGKMVVTHGGRKVRGFVMTCNLESSATMNFAIEVEGLALKHLQVHFKRMWLQAFDLRAAHTRKKKVRIGREFR